MWSQTSISRSLGVMRRLAFAVLTTVLIAGLLAGCGYQFAGKEKSIFGSSRSTLRLTGVDNPTMYAWLPNTLRSLMRDEVNKRHLATWVDSSPSDYSMRIKINDFTLRSAVRDSSDTTLLYSASLTFEATVYSGATNTVVWRSGKEHLSRTYDSKDEEAAGSEAAQLLVQRVCDRMRHAF